MPDYLVAEIHIGATSHSLADAYPTTCSSTRTNLLTGALTQVSSRPPGSAQSAPVGVMDGAVLPGRLPRSDGRAASESAQSLFKRASNGEARLGTHHPRQDSTSHWTSRAATDVHVPEVAIAIAPTPPTVATAAPLARASCARVKSRYPCSGLAPVAVFHPARGLGRVGAGGSSAGVGEGAVLA